MVSIRSRDQRIIGLAVVVAALLTPVALMAAEDDPPATATPSTEAPAKEPPSEESDAPNVYLAKPGLSAEDLGRFLERMRDKPQSLRSRPGFQEAIIDAAERILSASGDAASDAVRDTAILARFEAWHFLAFNGSVAADERLAALAAEFEKHPSEAVAAAAKFYGLEQRVLAAAAAETDTLAPLVEEVRGFAASTPLDARHLRLASGTVALINRLPDDEQAAQAYLALGELLAKSEDREVAGYGRKIAKAAKPPSLVGKPFELAGVTVDGLPFDGTACRGKIVLVDFWASWCGPCRAELPHLRELHAKYQSQGLVIVGVSLDTDREALTKFLAEEPLPWTSLFAEGEEAGGWKHPMAVRYNVTAIPATFLVDREGKVLAQDLHGEELVARIAALLGDAAEPATPQQPEGPAPEPQPNAE